MIWSQYTDIHSGNFRLACLLPAKIWICFWGLKICICIHFFYKSNNHVIEAKEMVMLELQKMSGGEADRQEHSMESPNRKLQKAPASNSVFD